MIWQHSTIIPLVLAVFNTMQAITLISLAFNLAILLPYLFLLASHCPIHSCVCLSNTLSLPLWWVFYLAAHLFTLPPFTITSITRNYLPVFPLLVLSLPFIWLLELYAFQLETLPQRVRRRRMEGAGWACCRLRIAKARPSVTRVAVQQPESGLSGVITLFHHFLSDINFASRSLLYPSTCTHNTAVLPVKVNLTFLLFCRCYCTNKKTN